MVHLPLLKISDWPFRMNCKAHPWTRMNCKAHPWTKLCTALERMGQLNHYTLSIYGAIDGFSRKVLWLKCYVSIKNPQLYIDNMICAGGVPVMFFADMGTEKCRVRDIQHILRWDHNDHSNAMNSFRYVHNQLHSACVQVVFSTRLCRDIHHTGIIDCTDTITSECISLHWHIQE